MIQFTRKQPKRRWKCKKKIKLRIESPDKSVVSKTRKKTRKTREQLKEMDSTAKKQLLETKGILKTDSKAPNEVITLIISNLVQ